MPGEPSVHLVREIVRKSLPGNLLKAFAPAPSGEGRTFVLHLRRRPFKAVLKVLEASGDEATRVIRDVEHLLSKVEGVRVPEVLDLDVSMKGIPFPYYVRSYLPGLSWQDILSLLSAAERLSLASRVGAALAIFHGIRGDGYGGIRGGERRP